MKLSFRHSLLLACCAVLIFAGRQFLNSQLGYFTITLTLFFLLLAKSGISHRFTGIATGGLAGILLFLFAGTPFSAILHAVLIPGFIIDLIVIVYPPAINSTLLCAVTAGIAASSPAVWNTIDHLIGGSNFLATLQKSITTYGTATIFAMLGGLPVPWISRKAKILKPSTSKTASSRRKR